MTEQEAVQELKNEIRNHQRIFGGFEFQSKLSSPVFAMAVNHLEWCIANNVHVAIEQMNFSGLLVSDLEKTLRGRLADSLYSKTGYIMFLGHKITHNG